jgi:hypothetical protein
VSIFTYQSSSKGSKMDRALYYAILQNFNFWNSWNSFASETFIDEYSHSERTKAMTKTPAPHGAYRIFEDAFLLAGSFAKLGSTIAAHKIQSGAETANSYIHSKVDLTDLDERLSSASAGMASASDYALHTDVKHMVDDVGAFARKHPVTALISVVAVGAMFSRLLMRSEPADTKVAVKTATPKATPIATKLAAKPRNKGNGTKQAHV